MEVFEIKPSVGKGQGVFAKRDIQPGTTILSDQSIMQIPKVSPQHTDQEIRHAFNKLGPAQQAQFLALHEGSRPFRTKLLRIFKANAFGTADVSHIYLDVSRFNHSCKANAELDFGLNGTGESVEVIAIRPISRGEEVLICYNELFPNLTTRQRGNILLAYYGFACSCTSCMASDYARMLSDATRQLISAVSFPLIGNLRPDVSHFDALNATNAESMPGLTVQKLPTPLTHQAYCAYSFLHTKSLEAEGLSGHNLASAYFDAACALLQQMVEMQDIIVLRSAAVVKEWAEKGIAIMTSVRGHDGHATVYLREQWDNMLAQPQLYHALNFLNNKDISRRKAQQPDGTSHDIFALWHRNEAN